VAQDHNVIGGLGSLVSQVIAENRLSCNYEVLGCPDYFVPVASSGYLYHKFGYDEVGLVSKMKNLCGVDK
jgi:transketolase